MRTPFVLPALALLTACVASLPQVPPVAADPAAAPADESFFCRYKLNPWYLPGGELRLERAQPAFVSFEMSHRAGVELTMPFGPASQGMDAVFTSGWVTFRAHYLPAKPFEVTTRVPMQFGPVLTFEEGATVSWLGSDDAGRMLVERAAPEHYRPATSLRTSLRCEDTTIGRDFPKKSDAAEAAEPRLLLLATGVDVPVSGTPGGAAEGHLRYDQDDWGREAQLLEEGPQHVRIRKQIWPGTIDGWVSREHTAAPKDDEEGGGLSTLFGVGGLGTRGEGRGTPKFPRCAAETTLYLARDGALSKVGEIHKGAAVLAGDKLPDWTVIALPELDWMRLAPGSSWAVKPDELARCLPTAPGLGDAVTR